VTHTHTQRERERERRQTPSHKVVGSSKNVKRCSRLVIVSVLRNGNVHIIPHAERRQSRGGPACGPGDAGKSRNLSRQQSAALIIISVWNDEQRSTDSLRVTLHYWRGGDRSTCAEICQTTFLARIRTTSPSVRHRPAPRSAFTRIRYWPPSSRAALVWRLLPTCCARNFAEITVDWKIASVQSRTNRLSVFIDRKTKVKVAKT